MTYIPDKIGLGQGKQLAQSQLTNSAASYYSPPANIEAKITRINITNTDSVKKWFTLWVDDDGTTYDNNTVQYYQIEIDPGSGLELCPEILMNNSSGNLAMQAEDTNVITATLYGIEYDVS